MLAGPRQAVWKRLDRRRRENGHTAAGAARMTGGRAGGTAGQRDAVPRGGLWRWRVRRCGTAAAGHDEGGTGRAGPALRGASRPGQSSPLSIACLRAAWVCWCEATPLSATKSMRVESASKVRNSVTRVLLGPSLVKTIFWCVITPGSE